MIVPVLSRHKTSTRANISTDASSLHKARCLAKATTPVMKERLVSRTSPSGTIATAEATVPRKASSHRSSVDKSLRSKRPTEGGMIIINQRSIVSTPERKSLSTSLKRRASSAKATAYESTPIRVAL